MNYLFVDFECANCFGGVGKICEFGYVLTDEKFNVIRTDDIPMSPGSGLDCRFNLKGRKGGRDLVLAEDEDFYYSCPEFPEYYQHIRKLFENKDTQVFGYSVKNDILFLDGTIKRYNKEEFNYVAYDIQAMMKYYSENREKFLGLKSALIQLGLENKLVQFKEHLPRDDAFMSMLVVKEMCKNLEVTLPQLIELSPSCKIDVLPYIKDFVTNKAKKPRDDKDSKCEFKIMKTAQIMWGDFYRENSLLLEKEESIGKIITISAKIKEDINVLEQVIQLIKKRHLVAYDRIVGADMILVANEEDKERLLKHFIHPYNGKFVLYNDFIDNNWKI
jgi:hypothetical protein